MCLIEMQVARLCSCNDSRVRRLKATVDLPEPTAATTALWRKDFGDKKNLHADPATALLVSIRR